MTALPLTRRSRHDPPAGRTRVTMFSGGRGGASIARRLLRTPGVDLSVVINGYDNGHSTGALRRYLPGMLGPSDFRKNLLLHLDDDDPRQAALAAVLRHRLPAGAAVGDLARLADVVGTGDGGGDEGRLFAVLPAATRSAIAAELAALRDWCATHQRGLDLADCALGNLVIAGAYLRLGRDFNAAVRSVARTFGSPATLLNVTNGENAFLVALKQDGRVLDEAEIVAPQDAVPITDLFLLRGPVTAQLRSRLAAQPVDEVWRALAADRATVSLNPAARDAIRSADLLIYGPGTPHSSLLPSYLTPGIADAVAASLARAKVFVANLQPDHDVQGRSVTDLVDLALAYLGDPVNRRPTITHVLCHRAVPAHPGGTPAGARWMVADLADPHHPDIHCGRSVVSALAGIARLPGIAGIAGKAHMVRTW